MSLLLPYEAPLFTYRIEVAGEGDEPDAHYLVTAETALIAMLLANLIHLNLSQKPINPHKPFPISEQLELDLAKQNCKVIP